MNVKIDRADYTILYGVSEEQWPAWLLLKEETIGGVNRFWPGLPARELTEHFFRLWSEELIECAEGEDEPAIAPDYELARQQFEFARHLRIAHKPTYSHTGYRPSAETLGRAMPEWIGASSSAAGTIRGAMNLG